MREMVLVPVYLLGTDTTYGIEILHQYSKRVKSKSLKVLRAIPMFVEVTEEKLVFLPTSILNKVKSLYPTKTSYMFENRWFNKYQ